MNVRTLGLLVVGVALLVGLFVIFKPKNQSPTPTVSDNQPMGTESAQTTPTPAIYDLIVRNNQLVAGSSVISRKQNDSIILRVTVDSDEELHLHGYEKILELKKDVPASLELTTNLTGRFILELEKSHTEIGVLEVQP